MKLPPVIVFALPVLIGWAADRLWPVTGFSFAAQDVIAAVILLCGVGLLLLAVTGFRLKKTTVNPLDPGQASALVDDGIYRISRNPMYLGMALFVLGVGLGQGWSVTDLDSVLPCLALPSKDPAPLISSSPILGE